METEDPQQEELSKYSGDSGGVTLKSSSFLRRTTMIEKRIWLGSLILVAVLAQGSLCDEADPNLMGWWKLDGDAADSSGNKHDGVLYGGTEWVSGFHDGALACDGQPGTRVEMPSATPAAGFAFTGAITWALWMKSPGNPTGITTLMLVGPPGAAHVAGNKGLALEADGSVRLRAHSVGTALNYKSNTIANDNEWHHVAVTLQFETNGENDTIKVYLNGSLTEGYTATDVNYNAMGNPADRVVILGHTTGWAPLNGMLDDVRVYDRALSAEEVTKLAYRPCAYAPNPRDAAVGVVTPLFQWKPGMGTLFHNVYLGTSPELGQQELVAPRQVLATYYHAPGLLPGTTYYWRVDEVDPDETVHTGDVWSFEVQALTAYHPSPADGANDAAPTPMLTWLPGQTATKHHLYFGDSNDAVSKGAVGTDKGELEDPNFVPGTLESLTTHYWRVDELVVGGAVRTGPVWKFTTYLSVDDFESYTDDVAAKTTIYDTWIDGVTDGLSGSTVGNINAPFAEQKIVYGGKQSMPLDFNNVKSPHYSEAEREFAPTQDWTAKGADTLVLYVRGASGNKAAPFYVALEDSSQRAATVTHPDPALITTIKWTAWRIPLSQFTGVNLAKVKKMYLGVGDRQTPTGGSAGRIYIDDIRVTKP